jgi:DNA-directed RNA polymerase subunit E'/Rpb7
MSNTVIKKKMENTRKPQYNKGQDSGLYSEMMITKKVPVHISNIGDNTIDMLQKVISRDIEGKCIVEGYIKPNTVKIITFSSGIVNGDYIMFETIFKCYVCSPVEGMHINCIATHINKAGIKAELDETPTPVIIFIARDHNYNVNGFSDVQKNDKIKVRVIGQRFELNDSHISIIAEFLEISKLQEEPIIELDTIKPVNIELDNKAIDVNEEEKESIRKKRPTVRRSLKIPKKINL